MAGRTLALLIASPTPHAHASKLVVAINDADSDFADPGDEAAEVDVGCDCVIHVDKLLVIVSRDRAGATFIATWG